MSQKDEIWIHLKRGHSITPIEALEMFGCFRLSGRIRDLRDEGMDIKTEMIEKNGKRFARYSLNLSHAEIT